MVAKRFLKRNSDPLAVAIIAGVILLIISAISPQLRGLAVKALLSAWEGVIWTCVLLNTKYSVPGWVIVIGGSWAFVRLWRGLWHLSVRRSPQDRSPHQGYTEDLIYGMRWRWSWDGRHPSALACFCPDCDAQLVASHDSLLEETYFICERCPPNSTSFGFKNPLRIVTRRPRHPHYTIEATAREIQRKVRTGEKP